MSSNKWKKPLKHKETEDLLQVLAERFPPNHKLQVFRTQKTTEISLQWQTAEGNTMEKIWQMQNTQLPSQQM